MCEVRNRVMESGRNGQESSSECSQDSPELREHEPGKGEAERETHKQVVGLGRDGQQTLCLARSDATQGDQGQNGATIGVHNRPHRMRTVTRLPSAQTRTSVPGRLQVSCQKVHSAPQKLTRPTRQTTKRTSRISGR